MSIKILKPIKRFWRGLTLRMRVAIVILLAAAVLVGGFGIYLLVRPDDAQSKGTQSLFPGVDRADISKVLCHTVSGEEYTVKGDYYSSIDSYGQPQTYKRFYIITSDGVDHSGLSLNSMQLSSFVVGTGKNYVYSAVTSAPAASDPDYAAKLAEYESKCHELGFSDESAFYELTTEAGTTYRVYYGIKDVTGDGYYVRLDGDSTIYSTKSAFVGDLLQQTGPESLLDSTLFYPALNQYAYAFPYRYSIHDYIRVTEETAETDADKAISKDDYAVGYTVKNEDGSLSGGSIRLRGYDGENAASAWRRTKALEFFEGRELGVCNAELTIPYPDTEDMGDYRDKTEKLWIDTVDYITRDTLRMEVRYLSALDREPSHKLSAYKFTDPSDMTSYIPDSDTLLTMLENTMSLSGTVVKLGIDDAVLEKYGLYRHQIWFSYPLAEQFAVNDAKYEHDADDTEAEKTAKDQAEEQAFFANKDNFLEVRLYVSDVVVEDGVRYRYVASLLYDLVVKVEASKLDFMDQSAIEYVDDFMITAQITDVQKFQMIWNYGNGKWMQSAYSFEAVMKDVVTGSSGVVDQNGNAVGGQTTTRIMELKATPIGGGDPITLALPLDGKGEAQPYEPYYQLYQRLTYSHYRGEHGLSDEQLAEFLAKGYVLRIEQLLTDGTANYWEFYPISANRVLVRVKNGKNAEAGAYFVIYGTALNDIARCYQKMMDGEDFNYENRYDDVKDT